MPGHAQEIQLAHGGGGRMTQQLIDRVFLPAFRNRALEARHDGAVLSPPPGVRLAFTTDAHVVRPLFFRGGDIGQLAVNGTCNDLAMCGARPRYLSAGFILEEGLPIETLERVVASMARAAADNAVQIVAGDTKVVERGRADGMYITTAGIGWVEHEGEIGPGAVQAGDLVLLSGDIGRHGMAILSQREGLAFESPIESDCAPLWPAVAALLEAGIAVRCLRDLTRGGLATALIEIAEAAHSSITIDENSVTVSQPVQAACEILGLDPLYVANEGRLVAFVRAADADAALRVLAATAPGGPPAIIGHVGSDPPGDVTLGTKLGVPRVLDRLSGEQLPRIC
jgi:hydrogenase expression/formation protein HypE